MILRDFLAGCSPRRYAVAQGFICDPTKPDQVSKQCDILTYDQVDYPLVHSEGEMKVVWPESVQVVIEVKTRLNKDQLEQAIENIHAAKRLRPLILGLVFAFGSSRANTIIKNLQQYSKSFPMEYAPEVIFLLDKKTFFIASKQGRNEIAYQVRTAKDSGVLITYLLMRFLNKLSSSTGVPQGALSGTATSVLIEETEQISQGIKIGG